MAASAGAERWMPPPLVAYVIGEVAGSLGYLHGLGVVHQDVSPDNIMLSFDGLVKVIDFGIAKMNVARVEVGERVRAVLGREEYAAPEVKQGLVDVDGRADLYSLGVVLWRLLARRRVMEVFLATVAAGDDATAWCPPRPSIWNSEVTSWGDDVVRQAVAYRREERFQTGRQMRAGLAGLIPPFGFDGRGELANFLRGMADVDRQRALLEEDLVVGRQMLEKGRSLRRVGRVMGVMLAGALAIVGLRWGIAPGVGQMDSGGWRRAGLQLVKDGRITEAAAVFEREYLRNPDNEVALTLWRRMTASK
jgi:hypothetical protein